MTGEGDGIRVLVVDDNHVVRLGLTMVVDAQPGLVVVGEADSGQACVDAVAELAPDVVLLDVRMPGSFDGVVAAGMVSDRTRVLMMTYADDQLVVRQALENGARGYLVHGDAGPDDIATAIRTVHGGNLYLSGRAGEVLVGMLPAQSARGSGATGAPGAATGPAAAGVGGGAAAYSGPVGSTVGGLTPREVEIMDLLAEGRANPDIAGRLYISPSTLKNHITRIFDKLGVRTRAEAIVLWLSARAEAAGASPAEPAAADPSGRPGGGQSTVAAASHRTGPSR